MMRLRKVAGNSDLANLLAHCFHDLVDAGLKARRRTDFHRHEARRFGIGIIVAAAATDPDCVSLHRAVRDFHKRIDTMLLGTRASKRPRGQRTNGLLFVEHAGRNIHGHAFLRFADQENRTLEELQTICNLAWSAICPGGDVLVQAQYDGGPGLYPSKELERRGYDFDQTILFSTFVSKD